MSTAEIHALCKRMAVSTDHVQIESLQAFDTEQQFCKQIKYVESTFVNNSTY